MTRRFNWATAACAAVALTLGCNDAQDEFAPAVKPAVVKFEGKLVPKFVGTWKASDGSSTLDILKDGSMKTETTSHSIAGKSVVAVSGQWLATNDALLFQYQSKTNEKIVLKYAATVVGNVLTLNQSGTRLKTAYRRK